jgi:hypothetical protein
MAWTNSNGQRHNISYMGLIRGVRDFTPVCNQYTLRPQAERCINLQTGVKFRTPLIRPVTHIGNLFPMLL